MKVKKKKKKKQDHSKETMLGSSKGNGGRWLRWASPGALSAVGPVLVVRR
jgi:hypothetical protein